MIVYEESCKLVNVTPAEVVRLARRLERVALDAQRTGLQVFGGAGSGYLRFLAADGPVIVASIDGSWSGGDGGCEEDSEGVMRGES